MKKQSKWVILSLTAVLTACNGNTDNEAEDQNSSDNNPDNGVNIGYFPNLDHAAAIIGKENGYFEEEMSGSELEFQNFPNGNDFIDALDTGIIDLGYVGPGPAINYFLSGGEVVLLGSAANGATLIVSREDSGIETIEDLEGNSFATPGNGCTHNVQLEQMMGEKDLTTNRIGGEVEHQPNINPASTVAMFEQGEIDATAAPEPWGTLLEQEHDANVVTEWDDVFLGDELASVVIATTPEFLEENPEEVEQALTAHEKSVGFANDNEEETLDTVNNLIYDLTQTKLPEDVLENAWERMEVTSTTYPDALQSWADASHDLQFMDEDPDLDGLVDTEILDNIE